MSIGPGTLFLSKNFNSSFSLSSTSPVRDPLLDAIRHYLIDPRYIDGPGLSTYKLNVKGRKKMKVKGLLKIVICNMVYYCTYRKLLCPAAQSLSI